MVAKKSDVLRPQLWTPRDPKDTIAVYAEWAQTYDADIVERGYHTPERMAFALLQHAKPDTHILDFGCGTGLSGQIFRQHGLVRMDGTDVTAEMLDRATKRGVYRKTWLSQPGALSFGRGAYPVIAACGVVSLGAAPARTLGDLMAKLNPGGLLAVSFNDPTLKDQTYIDALGDELSSGRAEVIFREHGPHLDDINMRSDIVILRRR